MIVARQGEHVIKIMLPSRFQEAIDEAAMRMGKINADAYTSGWNHDPWIESKETPQVLADQIFKDLENKFSEKYMQKILDGSGEN